MIPYARQDIQQVDIDAVIDVLKSDFLTQGPTIEKFETALGQYINAKYNFAVCNATSALHIACLALGLKKGDLVWASPITFVASTNCALYCGAKVDFVDIDPGTWNISPNQLEIKIAAAKKNNLLPKILIVTHFGGESCDMAAIKAIVNQYDIKIIVLKQINGIFTVCSRNYIKSFFF
jgi:dTDP-4-amino-4,6-dideoxygalactose transaminase